MHDETEESPSSSKKTMAMGKKLGILSEDGDEDREEIKPLFSPISIPCANDDDDGDDIERANVEDNGGLRSPASKYCLDDPRAVADSPADTPRGNASRDEGDSMPATRTRRQDDDGDDTGSAFGRRESSATCGGIVIFLLACILFLLGYLGSKRLIILSTSSNGPSMTNNVAIDPLIADFDPNPSSLVVHGSVKVPECARDVYVTLRKQSDGDVEHDDDCKGLLIR